MESTMCDYVIKAGNCFWELLAKTQTTNIIYILVVVTALAAPFIFQNHMEQKRKKLISFVLFSHLCQLRELIKRIQSKRNKPGDQQVVFNETSFCEVKSEFYLYQDVFLKNLEPFNNLEKYINVMNFFRNYKANVETLEERKRIKERTAAGAVSLGKGTVDNLLDWLEKAIDEVRLKDAYFDQAELEITKLIGGE